jgi:hypothetical protein
VADPADVRGDEARIRRAFEGTLTLPSRRIDLLPAVPRESLEPTVLAQRVRSIGSLDDSAIAPPAGAL